MGAIGFIIGFVAAITFYILTLQYILARKVSAQQGNAVFFFCALIISVPLFYGLVLVSGTLAHITGISEKVKDAIAPVALGLAVFGAPILSVLLVKRILRGRKTKDNVQKGNT